MGWSNGSFNFWGDCVGNREHLRGGSNATERWLDAAEALATVRQRNRVLEVPLLVEGKRDERALAMLGFTGPIERLNRGWPIERVVTHLFERYGARHAIDGGPAIVLLMDWDRTGGRLQRTLREKFESLDVVVDEHLRRRLMVALKPETTVVEGMIGLVEALRPLIDGFDQSSSTSI